MTSVANTVNSWFDGLWILIMGIIVLAGLLTLMTGMIWIERRVLARFQDRLGPNRVGPFGLLQPIADVIKLFMKEDWIPPSRNYTRATPVISRRAAMPCNENF